MDLTDWPTGHRLTSEDAGRCSFYPTVDLGDTVIIGPTLSICASCVIRCQSAIRELDTCDDPESARWHVPAHLRERSCAFCGRPPAEARLLLAHEVGSICDHCVEKCAGMLRVAGTTGANIAW